MILALLSRRFRAWMAFVVVLPLLGRLLQALGLQVSGRNPRVGRALTAAGNAARSPQRARSRRPARVAP